MEMASFLDKVKVGVDNVGSHSTQKLDELSYSSKISDKKSEISKLKAEAGDKIYNLYSEDKPFDSAEVKELCDKIKQCYAEIEELEAKKKELAEKGHEERQSRRDSVKD